MARESDLMLSRSYKCVCHVGLFSCFALSAAACHCAPDRELSCEVVPEGKLDTNQQHSHLRHDAAWRSFLVQSSCASRELCGAWQISVQLQCSMP
eukprot:4335257-Amphidinium_carterae.1